MEWEGILPMNGYTGFKHTTFKASLVSKNGWQHYKGRAICYENGRRLWQKTSEIYRISRGEALKDAQQISHDYIINSI